MTDLPQHAAQIALYKDHVAGGDRVSSSRFRKNYFTPVIGGYALAFATARVLPIRIALKAIISVALISLVLLSLGHVRMSGGNDWWTLPVFATLAGFPFYWGFYNFLVAMPLALGVLALTRLFVAAPSLRLAGALAAGAHAIFFVHALGFGFATAASGLMIALARLRRGWKSAGLLALATPFPLVVLWLKSVGAGVADSTTPDFWDLGLHRLFVSVTLPFGSAPSGLMLIVGTFLLLYPFLNGARLGHRLVEIAPVMTCGVILVAGPRSWMGTDLIYPRFAALLLPCMLIALTRRQASESRHAAGRNATVRDAARRTTKAGESGRSLPARVPQQGPQGRPAGSAWTIAAVAVTLVLLGTSAWKAVAYAQEDTLASVLGSAPPGRRMLYLPLDRSASRYPYPIYMHSGAWYASEVGGITDFSFAEYFPVPFRYAPGRAPRLYELPRHPERFSWSDYRGETYDLFLVRSDEDPAERVFAGAPLRPDLRTAFPPWWLYER